MEFELPHMSRRPRRGRSSESIRQMLTETHISTASFIQPLFVVDGNTAPEPIASMPGQFRLNIQDLGNECLKLYQNGIRAVALFPSIPAELKNAEGTEALNPETLILRAIRSVKQVIPELCLIADIALDPYTDHGHDGVLTADGMDVDNDRTVAILAKMAVLTAEAGVDWVAPSDMMDGRVGALRQALDQAGFTRTSILAYSAKFNSAYYGPFRDAVGSSKAAGTRLLGKQSYQLNPANRKEALIEARLDEDEGADILMVKPAGMYLDIIRDIRERTQLPLAAYQVSGEYAQIHAAAQLGWLDLRRVRDESLIAIRRAGADLILTYFAGAIAKERAGGMDNQGIPEYSDSGGI
jgi:porphobilinogen synthase